MKILITGGHLTPALAVLDKLLQIDNKKKIDIIFVGRKHTLENEKAISLEYKEVVKRNIIFISLEAGRFNRFITVKSLRNLVKIPLGFFRAINIVKENKPELILSFGGYIALPIALAGFIFGIPVFTHEQALVPGLANRIISFFSKKVLCSFDETVKYFPSNKAVVTGNPIRIAIFQIKKKVFNIVKDRPVIYITGGSTGSHSINKLIKQILEPLLQKYIVIHQIGDTKEFKDFEQMQDIKLSLNKELSKNYFPVKHFLEDEIGYIYSLADIVIGRSGANTFFELIALEKPAILIPLPWSANNEQKEHADIFKKGLVGEVFNQFNKSKELLFLINRMIFNLESYRENFKKLKFLYRQDATEIIIKQIFNK